MTPQELMEEFFETTHWVGPVADWRDHLAETEESEDEPEEPTPNPLAGPVGYFPNLDEEAGEKSK